MMCGGTSDAKPADAEIQAIINEVILNNSYYSCVLKIYGGKIKAYSYILGALFLISLVDLGLTTHRPSSEMLHLRKIY